MVGRVTPQFIPVNARAMNFHFGLAVPLGRRRPNFADR
jgi:hypothetical protein